MGKQDWQVQLEAEQHREDMAQIGGLLCLVAILYIAFRIWSSGGLAGADYVDDAKLRTEAKHQALRMVQE